MWCAMRERKPGIGGEEVVHAVAVAGEDHDQVVALVLHHLQQDLDRFLAVVPLVLRPVQVIGLVDEQHAAHGPLEHFLGLGRGMADILADQVVAGHRNQMAFAHIAEAVKDARHAQRHRGLAGAGIAGEGHVQRRRRRRQGRAARARAPTSRKRRDLADALLHRREADQVAFELGDRRRDIGLRLQRLEVDDLAGRAVVAGYWPARRCSCTCSVRRRSAGRPADPIA